MLDVEQPEDYSVQHDDVNLLTFCRSMGSIFQSHNHERNVIEALCADKLEIAHAPRNRRSSTATT